MRLLRWLFACLFLLGATAAQAFPERPVRLIIPFGAGGTTDMIGRLFAQELSARLGQPVVAENRLGAGGNVGYAAAARAEPDGHTLVLAGTGLVSSPFIYRSVPYRLDELAPISLLVSAPNVLIVRDDHPARDVADFLARARAGGMVYATAGIGSSSHLANVMFYHSAGVRLDQVNYTGGAAAFLDLLAGRFDAMMYPVPETLSYLQSRRVRALALTAPSSAAVVQGVPTVAQAGFPDAELVGWWGLLAPARTPAPILALLEAKLGEILASASLQQKAREMTLDVMPAGRTEFARLLAAQGARWQRFVAETGLRID